MGLRILPSGAEAEAGAAALKGKMGLGGYGFFFTLSGAPDMNAGIVPAGDGTARAVAQRVVRYNGTAATASLSVYALGGG